MMAFSITVAAYDFPSTNDQNKANGRQYVEEVDKGVGWVTLNFVQPNSWWACFEYRTDGDTSQATGDPNYNDGIPDLYPFICLNAESQQQTFNANEYVEIRSVFGAERDDDFDWTRFDVGQGQEVPEFPTSAAAILAAAGAFITAAAISRR